MRNRHAGRLGHAMRLGFARDRPATRLPVLLALFGLSGACGDGAAPGGPVLASSLVLDAEVVDLFRSEAAALEARATDAQGQPIDVPMDWSSADESVARVEAGVVTGVGPGATEISVRAGGLRAAASVRVAVPPSFVLPVEGVAGRDYHVTYFPAHPGGTEQVVDFRCGTKAPRGHVGTDFSLTDVPAMWNDVVVRAAAPGVVARIHDGEPDRNTWGDTTAVPNEVVLDHGDGVRTVYQNLQKERIPVSEGQRVEVGDPLGLIGSSGVSEVPHLHFEVRLNDRVVDPSAGPCSGPLDLWAEPPAYDDAYHLLRARVSDYQLPAPGHLRLDAPPAADRIPAGRLFVVWVQELNVRPLDTRILVLDAEGTVRADLVQVTRDRPLGMTWHSGRLTTPVDEPGGTWSMEYWHRGELRARSTFELVPRPNP